MAATILPATPTTDQSQATEQTPITLLAYDPRHEDILIGEIPVRFFAQRRLLTGLLRTGDLGPNERNQLNQALAIGDQLWFALMRLGKESHEVNREAFVIL